MTLATQPDESALDEAADWFSRFKRSEVSTAELTKFEAWYAQPGNDKAYAEVEAIWLAGEDLTQDPRLARLLAKTLAAHPASGSPAPKARRSGRHRRWAPIAVVATLSLVVGFVWLHRGEFGDSYQTAMGEQRLVRLADGSRLRLDTNTRLKVRLTQSERRIDLVRGQAFFEVAHDRARPFVVHAGDTTVQALGTRFDVRRDARQIRVALIEGSVKVEQPHDAKRWTLAPGQQWSNAAVSAGPTAADVGAATSWVGGRLTFHKTAFADAITEVNRYTNAPVRLKDPKLAQEQINGMFDTGDVNAFVAAATELYPLEAVRRADGGVDLHPKSSLVR